MKLSMERTDDGGFLISMERRGAVTTKVEKTVEHALDRAYEFFDANPKATKARLSIRDEKRRALKETIAAVGPRVNVTGPFPTVNETAKRLGVSKDEAARLSKLADSAISSLGALNTMAKPAPRAKSKAPRAKKLER